MLQVIYVIVSFLFQIGQESSSGRLSRTIGKQFDFGNGEVWSTYGGK